MNNIVITWSVNEIIGLCLLGLVVLGIVIALLGAYLLDKVAEFKKRRADSIKEFEKKRADRRQNGAV